MPLQPKEAVLGVLTIAGGLANAYLWRGVIFAGEFKDAAFYSLPVIALLAFAVLFSLAAIFIRSGLVRNATAIIAPVAGYLLLVPSSGTVLAAAAASGALGWYAADDIADEYAASSRFNVRKILRGGLPKFFTAVALALAVFYYSSLAGEPTGGLLSRRFFDALLPFLTGTLEQALPGFRADETVDEFIIKAEREKVGGLAEVLNLLPPVRKQLLERERQELGRQFGLALRGNEQLGDVFYKAVSRQLERLVAPYRQYLPFAAAAAFFLAVKTLTLPAYWLTLILTSLVVKSLLAMHVLRKEKIEIEVEQINL